MLNDVMLNDILHDHDDDEDDNNKGITNPLFFTAHTQKLSEQNRLKNYTIKIKVSIFYSTAQPVHIIYFCVSA